MEAYNFIKKHYSIVRTLLPLPPLSFFINGGIDFLKFDNKGGDEIFFLEREGLD